MNFRVALGAIALFVTLQCSAAGLSAAVAPCQPQAPLAPSSIGADIATALVRSLLGTTIDSVVTYLNDPKVATFDVILPIESMDELLTSTVRKCLFVSSDQPDSIKAENKPAFHTQIEFVRAKSVTSGTTAVYRPLVRAWRYERFLGRECRAFRNCSKRDVAFSLGLMAPAATISGRTISAEPLGFVVVNATAQEIQAAIPMTVNGAALPWFLLVNEKGPVNIRFSLVETSQPNAFTKALGAALAAQKGAMLSTVEDKLTGISDQVAAEAAQKDVTAAARALDNYKIAFDAAYTTKTAYEGSIDAQQRKLLSAQYQVQREAALLAAALGKAAFDLAGLTWPAGGFGPLPDL